MMHQNRFFKSINLILKIWSFMMILSFPLNSVLAQQYNLHYRLVKDNEYVGELWVNDNSTSEKRTIHTQLKAQIPVFLFHINLADQKSAFFKETVLQSAAVSRSFFSNNSEKKITLLSKNHYTDGKQPIASLLKHREITFSMTMLYTTEPSELESIYSEFHQCFVKVIKTGQHVYCIKTPEGQVGNYYYENGICVRVDTITAKATISTILVKNTAALK